MGEKKDLPTDEDMAAHLEHLQSLGGFAQRGRKFYRQINDGQNNDDGESDSEPENWTQIMTKIMYFCKKSEWNQMTFWW